MKNHNTDEGPLHTVGEISKNACNLTLLAGLSVAVGFIAGIFCAPKAGKELRRELEEKSHNFIDKAKEQIGKINQKIHPHLENFENRMQEYTKA